MKPLQLTKSMQSAKLNWRQILFAGLLIGSLFCSPVVTLFAGILFALTLGNPFPVWSKKASKKIAAILRRRTGIRHELPRIAGRRARRHDLHGGFGSHGNDRRRSAGTPAAHRPQKQLPDLVGHGDLRRQRHRGGRTRYRCRREPNFAVTGHDLHPQRRRPLRIPRHRALARHGADPVRNLGRDRHPRHQFGRRRRCRLRRGGAQGSHDRQTHPRPVDHPPCRWCRP